MRNGSMTVETKVLQAILELGDKPERVDAVGQVMYDLTIKSVTLRVNAMPGATVGVKKVGWIVRTKLQLRTARDGNHGGRYAVVWDGERLRGLAQRYGMEGLLERGGAMNL
jgi:hypothetical protein